jgi:hypothetical protein
MDWTEDDNKTTERNGVVIVDVPLSSPLPHHFKYFTPLYFGRIFSFFLSLMLCYCLLSFSSPFSFLISSQNLTVAIFDIISSSIRMAFV